MEPNEGEKWMSEIVSHCCGAAVAWGDFCQACHDHCQPIRFDDDGNEYPVPESEWPYGE